MRAKLAWALLVAAALLPAAGRPRPAEDARRSPSPTSARRAPTDRPD